MRLRIGFAVALVGVLGFVAGRAFTDEDKGQDMEEAFKALGTPGPQHDLLAQVAGEWVSTGTAYWKGTPEPMTSTSKFTSIMGKRYLKEEMTSTMDGQPFEGVGLHGYENATGKFVFVWYDNMSTGFMTGTSTYDEATKTFTGESEFNGPGGVPMKHRHVWKIVSPTEMTFEMYMVGEEGEMKMMEMTSKRK
jgi:hypothetical protein